MIYLCCIKGIDRQRRIIKRPHEVLPDIPDLRRIILKALQNITDMITRELHKLPLHHSGWLIVPGDPDHLPVGRAGIYNHREDPVYHLLLPGIFPHKVAIRELVPEVLFQELTSSHRVLSGKERIPFCGTSCRASLSLTLP